MEMPESAKCNSIARETPPDLCAVVSDHRQSLLKSRVTLTALISRPSREACLLMPRGSRLPLRRRPV